MGGDAWGNAAGFLVSSPPLFSSYFLPLSFLPSTRETVY